MLQAARTVVAFSRPHTIVGTTVSVFSSCWLTLGSRRDGDWAKTLPVVASTLVSALCMNIYIVGLNQLFDIPLDKVNKPYLPLANGDMSIAVGWALTLGCCAISISLAWSQHALLAVLLASCLLGTIYSANLPGLRWKRFPLLAGFCIAAVRGVIVQMGFYTHFRQAFALDIGPWYSSPAVIFAMLFMTIFAAVIALFKVGIC